MEVGIAVGPCVGYEVGQEEGGGVKIELGPTDGKRVGAVRGDSAGGDVNV